MECVHVSHGPPKRMVKGPVLCLLLFLLLSSLPPGSCSAVLEERDSPSSEEASLDQTLDLLQILRSVLTVDRLTKTSNKDAGQPEFRKRGFDAEQPELGKRGFGIAGLDNVDMITSTLDRSRSRSKPRSRYRPRMSLSVDLDQLRALMAKAG